MRSPVVAARKQTHLETLVRVPLAQQPSVRRGTADLCPGRQVSSVQALLCV